MLTIEPPATTSNSESTTACSAKPSTTTRKPVAGRATLWDGVEILYRAWLPDQPTDRAIVLFHRGHEHSGRWIDFVDHVGLEQYAIFAWDARGHGRSPGLRGYAPSFGHLVKDVDSFVRHICKAHLIPMENMAIVANSVGAVIAAAWVHDFAPPIRAMVLATPAFRVKLYVPLAVPCLRLDLKMRGKERAFVKSYVKPSMLTHDKDMIAAYRNDKLISRNIAVNILLGLHDAGKRLLKDAHTIRTPTLVLSAGRDYVVSKSPQRVFFQRLTSRLKRMTMYADMHHAVYHERDRRRPIEETRRFIIEAFNRRTENDLSTVRDGSPAARAKDIPLRSPAPVWQRPYWWAIRASLKTVGRLSRGIRIGWEHGFDSGGSLDYVYRNRASGTTILGRLIDRFYLNSPGWRGIRERRRNVDRVLKSTIQSLRDDSQPVRILDVASGPGRYILEMMRDLPDVDVRAVLRDEDNDGLGEGRQLAESLDLADRVRFEIGDAFDEGALAAVEPRPHIAIASGLYELFDDNDRIERSLRGIHRALVDDGFLIYTNQPWHPQLEFIARVLMNRDGRPWVMRCRPQREMDALVRHVGFEKIDMFTDDHGIFTVSLARKRN